jgi:tetratricopeptide (TPR) repeat protein
MFGSYREEIEKLEALYGEHPEGRVFTHLAEAYRRAGELARARQVLESGLQRHPTYSSAHVVMGRVLMDEGALPAAQECFQRVMELDPHNVVALRALAELAQSEGREADAVAYYDSLLTLDPADEAAAAFVEEHDAVVESSSGPVSGEGRPEQAKQPEAAAWAAHDDAWDAALSGLDTTGAPESAEAEEAVVEGEGVDLEDLGAVDVGAISVSWDQEEEPAAGASAGETWLELAARTDEPPVDAPEPSADSVESGEPAGAAQALDSEATQGPGPRQQDREAPASSDVVREPSGLDAAISQADLVATEEGETRLEAGAPAAETTVPNEAPSPELPDAVGDGFTGAPFFEEFATTEPPATPPPAMEPAATYEPRPESEGGVEPANVMDAAPASDEIQDLGLPYGEGPGADLSSDDVAAWAGAGGVEEHAAPTSEWAPLEEAGPAEEPVAEQGPEAEAGNGYEMWLEEVVEEATAAGMGEAEAPAATAERVSDNAPPDELAGVVDAESGAEPVAQGVDVPAGGGRVYPSADAGGEPAEEMVTETMADLYMRQGLYDRAVELLRQLMRQRGHDVRLEVKLVEAEYQLKTGQLSRLGPGGGAPGAEREAGPEVGLAGPVETAPDAAGEGWALSAGSAAEEYWAASGGSAAEDAIQDAELADAQVMPEAVEAPEPWSPGGQEAEEPESAYPGIEDVEAMWTGREGVAAGRASPYAWAPEPVMEPDETEEAGSSIREYLGDLMGWAKAAGAQAEEPPPAPPPPATSGGDDDDLQMFRAWLQSLKR